MTTNNYPGDSNSNRRAILHPGLRGLNDQGNFSNPIPHLPPAAPSPIPSGKFNVSRILLRRGVVETLLFLLGFFILGFVLLAVFSFSKPAVINASKNVQYANSGAFAYAGDAPAGIYDSNSINSGDPIFPQLTCQVFFQFDYVLDSNDLQNVAGSYQLTALVTDQVSGWKHIIALQPETAFKGNKFTSVASANFCEIQKQINAFELQTNFHPALYQLIINPNIRFAGSVGGQVVNSAFNPSLEFDMDQVHAYLVYPQPDANVLQPTEEGSIKIVQKAPNTLAIIGSQPRVSNLRVLSLIGLVICTVFLGGLFFSLSRLQQQQESDFNQMKYGKLMINVKDTVFNPNTPVIDVITLDDLALLAERGNTVILHTKVGKSDLYYVQGSHAFYRYNNPPTVREPEL